MSRAADLGLLATHFARTRWGRRWRDRAALLAWQERRLRDFLDRRLPHAPFYARATAARVTREGEPPRTGTNGGSGAGIGTGGVRLADLPIVDKQTMLSHFDGFNTRGIRYQDAMAVALAAERSRDFRPELSGEGGDLTVGLSSGTSGQRGLFVVSRRERLMWAGTMLARTLSPESLARLASPWRAPLVVAFFLRANSNLYGTLHSRRLTFSFHDLMQPLDTHLAALQSGAPDVLVAPATVLRWLAAVRRAGRLDIAPRQVISVAETLEQDDSVDIARVFGVPVQQIYQATEGFLGYTCEAGTVHLNEECVHIEPEWLDTARTRFHPILTDFTRETQLIVRYRLDDVLRLAEGPCSCGRVSVALAGVDGRRDAVLLLPSSRGDNDDHGTDGTRAIFPDLVRRAMMMAGDHFRDYRILQTDAGLVIRLADADNDAAAAIRAELTALFVQQEAVAPAIAFLPWQGEAAGDKCCRIRRVVPPVGHVEHAHAGQAHGDSLGALA